MRNSDDRDDTLNNIFPPGVLGGGALRRRAAPAQFAERRRQLIGMMGSSVLDIDERLT